MLFPVRLKHTLCNSFAWKIYRFLKNFLTVSNDRRLGILSTLQVSFVTEYKFINKSFSGPYNWNT